MPLPEDIFVVYVESTPGEGCFDQPTIVSRVEVLATTANEATLTALEIVACRRCPVSAAIDWDDF